MPASDLFALVYVSNAGQLSLQKIETILQSAQDFNRSVNVTGVLLYSNGNFLQYLEGDNMALTTVYERIKSATSHSKLTILLNTSIKQRYFSDWDMGYAQPTESQMLALSTSRWQLFQYNKSKTSNLSDGLKILISFWSVASSQTTHIKN